MNTDPMNMDALDFDGDMWDLEYCDSELRAVEASGESRDERCPCQKTQLKLIGCVNQALHGFLEL